MRAPRSITLRENLDDEHNESPPTGNRLKLAIPP